MVNVLIRLLPILVNALTMTTAISPAIQAYSKAVTARRSVFRAIQLVTYSSMMLLRVGLKYGSLLCLLRTRHFRNCPGLAGKIPDTFGAELTLSFIIATLAASVNNQALPFVE